VRVVSSLCDTTRSAEISLRSEKECSVNVVLRRRTNLFSSRLIFESLGMFGPFSRSSDDFGGNSGGWKWSMTVRKCAETG
jgi:hypothetical protein